MNAQVNGNAFHLHLKWSTAQASALRFAPALVSALMMVRTGPVISGSVRT
jgi:hypothetical protein